MKRVRRKRLQLKRSRKQQEEDEVRPKSKPSPKRSLLKNLNQTRKWKIKKRHLKKLARREQGAKIQTSFKTRVRKKM